MPEYVEQLKTEDGEPSPSKLHHWGPLIRVEIAVAHLEAAYLRERGQVPPVPVGGFALIDTGALHTGILPAVTRQLGLVALGTTTMLDASGRITARPVHRLDIKFPQLAGATIPIQSAIASDLGGYAAPNREPIICLIGRDALVHARFEYDGPAGRWSFAL